jgi:hypothetical protein
MEVRPPRLRGALVETVLPNARASLAGDNVAR